MVHTIDTTVLKYGLLIAVDSAGVGRGLMALMTVATPWGFGRALCAVVCAAAPRARRGFVASSADVAVVLAFKAL